MNVFKINGQDRELPIGAEHALQELLDVVRSKWRSETSLVSEIRVNGKPLTAQDERVLLDVPIERLQSIEVFTSHPREVAEETIELLVGFLEHLSELCSKTASAWGKGDYRSKFSRLVEGFTTFHETLKTLDSIMHWSGAPESNAVLKPMEAELLAYLQGLLGAQQQQDGALSRRLLEVDLPAHFKRWKADTIPVLVRMRDS